MQIPVHRVGHGHWDMGQPRMAALLRLLFRVQALSPPHRRRQVRSAAQHAYRGRRARARPFAASEPRARYGRSEQPFKHKSCRDKCIAACQVAHLCVAAAVSSLVCRAWLLFDCVKGTRPRHVHRSLHNLLLSQRLLRGGHGQQVSFRPPRPLQARALSNHPYLTSPCTPILAAVCRYYFDGGALGSACRRRRAAML